VTIVLESIPHDLTPEKVLELIQPYCRPLRAVRDMKSGWLLEFSTPQEAVTVRRSSSF
jgi:hypothetical protein